MKIKTFIFVSTLLAIIAGCRNVNNSFDSVEIIELDEDFTDQLEDSPEPVKDSIQIKTIQIGSEGTDDKFRFRASYPITVYNFINDFEENTAKKFLSEFEYVANLIDTTSISSIDYNQHFDIIEDNASFIAFFIERFNSYGNNINNEFTTHLYDLESSKKINFEDLFVSEDSLITFSDTIKFKVEQKLKAHISEMTYLSKEEKILLWDNMSEGVNEGVSLNNHNFDAFIWDEHGKLTLYFDKYQIASGDFGIITVSFDPVTYYHLIDKKYQSLFDSDMAVDKSLEELGVEKKPFIPAIDCSLVPCIALTFDDGPSVHTSKLLDILKENNVKATFFVLGKSAEIQKQTLLRTYNEGHQIGNHSWDHKDLKGLTKEQVEHQIYDTNQVILDIIGEEPHILRPPYGSINSTIMEIANMPVILWTIDPIDWKDRDTKLVADRMIKAKQNDIILAHDIHESTVKAIPIVIKSLKEKGYYLVTIDELFNGQKLENNHKYFQR